MRPGYHREQAASLVNRGFFKAAQVHALLAINETLEGKSPSIILSINGNATKEDVERIATLLKKEIDPLYGLV